MNPRSITINGQRYDSPETMPAEVRRAYEEALRIMGTSLATPQPSDTTDVHTSQIGPGMTATIVTRRTVHTNEKLYGAAGELPPDACQLMQKFPPSGESASRPGGSNLRVSFELGSPKANAFVRVERPSPEEPHPFASWSSRPDARRIVFDLVFWVVVALVLWAFLDH